ncbi:MAG: DUF2232 domain-containing protein [Desulfobacca sp.]|uniref:DUF2232 domain-containing protein n=1 Tax=Desulfobacca sp. TaxID=2067990 RepID=UPI0040490359
MAAKQVPLPIISGLVALLLLYYASSQIPVAGLFVSLLLPLPLILTIDRAGWWGGLLVMAAALAILFYLEQFTGMPAEVLPLLHMSLLGLILAFLAARPLAPELVIGGAALGGLLFQVGVFVVQGQQQGLSPMAHLEQTVATVWSGLAPVLDKDQVLEKQLQQAGLTFADLLALVAHLTPALLLMNNTVLALLNYLLSRGLGTQQRWAPPKVPLPCWEAPGWLVFVLIGAGFLLLVPSQILRLAALNVLLICLLLYFFQGVAIIAFGFQRFQVPRFLRWSIYLLLIMIKPAMLLVVIMGLVDLWLDFRRLHQPPPSEA